MGISASQVVVLRKKVTTLYGGKCSLLYNHRQLLHASVYPPVKRRLVSLLCSIHCIVTNMRALCKQSHVKENVYKMWGRAVWSYM